MLKRFVAIFKDVFTMLLPAERKKIILLQVGIILSSVLQPIASVGIVPLIAVVTDITKVKNNTTVQWLLQKIPMSDNGFILAVAVAFLVLMLTAFSIGLLVDYKSLILSRNIKTNLQKQIFSYQLKQSYEKLTTLNGATLASQLGYECDIFSDTMVACLKVISSLFILLCYTVFFVYINVIFFVSISLIIGSAYGLMAYFSNKKMRYYSQQLVLSNTLKEKLLRQSYDGIREIKLRHLEQTAFSEFSTLTFKVNAGKAILNIVSLFPKYAIIFFLYTGIVIALLFYTFFVDGYAATKITSLAFFAISVVRIIPTTLELYNAGIALLGYRYALPNIKATVLAMHKNAITPSQTQTLTRPVSFNNHLRFESVTYRYPTANKPALNNLSFQIPSGKTVAFVGQSGSGKTTTADMLLGLLSPNSGSIYVDDQLIDENTLPSWHKLLTYVPQNVFLMDETLAGNIFFMQSENVTQQSEKLQQVIAMACLEDLVKELPQGLQTHVGERGVRLSGGQKQRIGIARALYTEAPVLVFDEATSALDMITEKNIMDTIFSLRNNKTVIIIAHRLSTVKKADIIYFFENGSVTASGSFGELYTTLASFRKMVDAGKEGIKQAV